MITKIRESDLIKGLEILGTLGVLAAIVFFFRDMDDRQEERIARSWQLLTTSAPGNSGKVEALEYLNRQELCLPWGHWCWKQRIPLRGIDLSPTGNRGPVDLTGVDLSQADLRDANLSSAVLEGANLHNARMNRASMSGANLRHANLTNALADNADFSKAQFDGAIIAGLHAEKADFSNSSMWDINAAGADLAYSNFSDVIISHMDSRVSVSLAGANFSGAILNRALFAHASLAGANFTNADATRAQFKEADLSGAVFSSTNLTGSFLTYNSGLTKEQFKSAWAWSDKPALAAAEPDRCLLSDLNIYNPAFWDPQWTPQNNYACAEEGITTVKQRTECVFIRYRSNPPPGGIRPSDKARIDNSSSCK